MLPRKERSLSYAYGELCVRWESGTQQELQVCPGDLTSCSPTTTSQSSSAAAFGTAAHADTENPNEIAGGAARKSPIIAAATAARPINCAGSAIR